MDLEIAFNGKSIITPVYIKMDAPEQILLAEGICRQLDIIRYHPDVQVWHGEGKQTKQSSRAKSGAKANVPTVQVRLLQATRIPPLRSVVVAVKTDRSLRNK